MMRLELSSLTTIDNIISKPGEILVEEYLIPFKISQYRFAKAIGKSQSAISDIVHGRRGITAEMAYLFSEALGTTPQYWLNLQMEYDLKTLDCSRLPEVEALIS